MWSVLQLLAPHAAVALNILSALSIRDEMTTATEEMDMAAYPRAHKASGSTYGFWDWSQNEGSGACE